MTDDRTPPYNRHAEQAVLGSMLRDNRCIDDVQLILTAEDFYTDCHQRLFRAVADLHAAGQGVDLVTLAEELHRRRHTEDVGGPAYLAELWDAAPTAGNAGHYARIVRAKATFRALTRVGQCIAEEGFNQTGTEEEAVERAEREVFALSDRTLGADDDVAADVVAGEVFDRIDRYCSGVAAGLLTGFTDLDAKTGGLHAGQLLLVAARTGVGKTALGCGITLNLAEAGHRVLFCTLEQERAEVGERMACSIAKVDSHALRKNRLTADQRDRLRAAVEQLRAMPLHFDHAPRQTILRISAKARRRKRRGGLDALVVDYLQLVESSLPSRAPRYEQVGDISRRLKGLAKELKVPVVCMAQLNRSPEDRADRRPRLSDLRESGNLEQDADTVILLHRPQEEPGCIELDIAKQRNGPTGVERLAYHAQWTRFDNYAAGQPPVGA
jgi:replicative DNA helicase